MFMHCGRTLLFAAPLAVFGVPIGHAIGAETSRFTPGHTNFIDAGQFVAEQDKTYSIDDPFVLTILPGKEDSAFIRNGFEIRVFRLDNDASTKPRAWFTFEPCDVYLSRIWSDVHVSNGQINLPLPQPNWLEPGINGTGVGRFLLIFETKTDMKETFRLNRLSEDQYFQHGLRINVLGVHGTAVPPKALPEDIKVEMQKNVSSFKCYRGDIEAVRRQDEGLEVAALEECPATPPG